MFILKEGNSRNFYNIYEENVLLALEINGKISSRCNLKTPKNPSSLSKEDVCFFRIT